MQRGDVHSAFDLVDRGEPVAIVLRDGHAMLRNDVQVGLDQPEHVEVMQEARRVVQPVERQRHACSHRPGLQRLGRHGGPRYELEHHHVDLRHMLQHSRSDPGRRRGLRVVDLVLAVDREQLRRQTWEAHHVAVAAGLDEVVFVGQTARERRDRDRQAFPQRNALRGFLSPRAVLSQASKAPRPASRRRAQAGRTARPLPRRRASSRPADMSRRGSS